MPSWYRMTATETLQGLNSDADDGLGDAAAQRLLQEHGRNELVEQSGRGPWRMLLSQFTETMVLVLLAAALASGLLGKITEMFAILAIVLMFAILGFVQEYRAEQAIAALKMLAVPNVRVRRGGQTREIPAIELVPGDIVVLEAGNIVPADVRHIEAVNLRIQEATLTGESEPVEKHSDALDQEGLPLGDRRNMGYMGTTVTYGRGSAVVVATGMKTELGQIATMLQEVEQEETPLQGKLDRLGKTLALVGVVAALLVGVVGLVSGESLLEVFVTAVSVAVAVIPEGLPAVVTITLALGAQRMLKRRALVRKLPAVETLGSVTVICSDKTGTLTENRMTVTMLDVAGQRLDLQESLRRHMPALDEGQCASIPLESTPAAIQLTLAAGALCNDATLMSDTHKDCYHTLGDPTEGALLVAAGQVGLFKEDLERWLPRVGERPFESDRKRMTTVHALAEGTALPDALAALQPKDASHIAITKGAIDGIMEIAAGVWVQDHVEPLSTDWRERIEAANQELASNGMRVLCMAFRNLDWTQQTNGQEIEERDLVILGISGMIDPPRPEVRDAVALCKAAGIRPMMITGDHPLTALAIAQDLDMVSGSTVLTGSELAQMPDSEFESRVRDASVFARVSPADKLRIVRALQKDGEIVAMTGDGVNDSPALRQADIGVAMGITGTDVAKQAADTVLLDDNFATIVSSVEQGRVIYDNLVRFVKFSVGGNFAKVLVMLLAPLLGIRVALMPLQLLWLNLLTDGLMGLGLGLEPSESDTMSRPPRNPSGSLIERDSRRHILWVGVLIGAITLAVGYLYYGTAGKTWQTMMFTTLAFTQIGHALGLRASTKSALAALTENPTMIGVTAATVLLQIAAVYVPFLDRFFGVVPLSPLDLGICVGLGVVVWVATRIEKRMLQRS